MVAIVHPPDNGATSNSGSSALLVAYLSKEAGSNLGFFTHQEEQIAPIDVQEALDGNCGQLGKSDSKFYMLSLNPSHDELCAVIGRSVNDKAELTDGEVAKIEGYLKELTHKAMDAYAQNFRRDKVQSADDLLYFARIETRREYKPTPENILARKPIWQEKEGLNYHVHVIVSRKSRDGSTKLSPNAISQGNEWELEGRVVRRGFDKRLWVQEVQRASDKLAGIHREVEDSISKCGNKDIRELSQYKFERASYVVEEMRQRGYKTYRKGEDLFFYKGQELFSIKNRDLQARETRLSSRDKLDAWSSFARGDISKTEFTYSVKRRFEASDNDTDASDRVDITERYLCSHRDKVIAGYKPCNLEARKTESREDVLAQLPDGEVKEILSRGDVYSFTEKIRMLEEAGYEHSFDYYHTFTKEGQPEVRLLHAHLNKLSKVELSTIADISQRFDLKHYRKCVDKTHYQLNDLQVEARTYTKKGGKEQKSYYVVRDLKTNSVVKLSTITKHIRNAQKGGLAMNIGAHKIQGYVQSALMKHTIAREAAPVLQGAQAVQSISRLVSSDPATAVTRELMAQVKKILLSSLKQI